ALPSDLVHLRPDIQQAEADLHAATAEVGVATAALYPSFNLTGSLTQSALTASKIFDPSSTAYSLGLGLAAPVFDGGRRRAEREGARAAARASLAA
ncbi:TolC family protein, partial [Mycobacterium tuberculosis]